MEDKISPTLDSILEYLSNISEQLENTTTKYHIQNEDIQMDTVETDNSQLSDFQIAINTINTSVRELIDLPSCVYFSNCSSPNISSSYPFANPVSIHVCSNKKLNPISTSVTPCISVTSQQRCVEYKMDYEIVSKHQASDKSFYLIRYRKITGSITYIIADSLGAIYQIISHDPSLSFKDNNLDQDAEALFYSYLTQVIDGDSIDLDKPIVEEKEQQPKKTSYLSYVLG